jgi:hypothetical protein
VRRSASRCLAPALALLALGLTVGSVEAQEPSPRRVTVRVRQVAGANVYLDVGTDHGVVAGDTLEVARDSAGPVVGHLAVVASTPVRSVLAFAGEPFPVTRGASLTLLLVRPARAALPEEARPVETTLERPGPSRAAAPDAEGRSRERRPYGRVSLDLATLHSVTEFGGSDPEQVDRMYATPTVRLSATVPDAVAGLRLRTGMRLAYRYQDGGFPAKAFSGRIHLAALEKTTGTVQLALGRFPGPVERFSGYWDGLHVRVGGRSLGVSALVGFQPELWNEGFSTALPKATAAVDWEADGPGWGWNGNVSAHTVRPRDEGVPDHTYLGLEQRLRAGPVRLDQDLRMDRTPDGGWRVGRLQLRGALGLAPGVELRAGVSRRRYWSLFPSEDPLGPLRDRATVGLSARAGRGRVSVDLSGNRRDGGDETRGVTASAVTGALSSLGRTELGGRVSWWEGDRGHTLSAAPSATFRVGTARLRAGYRFYRSVYLDRETIQHGVDGSARFRLGGGWSGDLRAAVRWSGGLRSERLSAGMARIF